MSTTIPALTSVDDILDTDLVMITHSNGQSYKMSGADINKRNQAVISANTTLTGTPLKTGNIVRVYFTADLTAANGTTPLTLSYNGVSYAVKVPKNGSLTNFFAFDLGGGTYKYLQANTALELLYDGTQFIVMGNDVLISTADYSIYTDGLKRINAVENNNMNLITSNAVKASKIWTEIARTTSADEVIDLNVNLLNYDEIMITTNKSNGRVEGSTISPISTFNGGALYVIGIGALNTTISSYGVVVWISNTSIELAGTYTQLRVYVR